MLLIRIDFNDTKYALILTIKIKNALTLTMGEEEEEAFTKNGLFNSTY